MIQRPSEALSLQIAQRRLMAQIARDRAPCLRPAERSERDDAENAIEIGCTVIAAVRHFSNEKLRHPVGGTVRIAELERCQDRVIGPRRLETPDAAFENRVPLAGEVPIEIEDILPRSRWTFEAA